MCALSLQTSKPSWRVSNGANVSESQPTTVAETSPAAEEPKSPLVVAIRSLTQGTQNLLKHHLELARHEAKADALELAKDIGGILIALGLALVGYLLLNLAAVFFAGWFAGLIGMAIATFALALLHIVGGLLAAKTLGENIQERHYGLRYTGTEIERSTEWAKETRELLNPPATN